MLIALIARDKDGALQVRKDNRDDHLAYIKETGVLPPHLPESIAQYPPRPIVIFRHG